MLVGNFVIDLDNNKSLSQPSFDVKKLKVIPETKFKILERERERN